MISIAFFSKSRMDVVQFVDYLLQHSRENLQLTTITLQVKSEGCCVFVVINTSSVEIVANLAHSYCLEPLNISTHPIPDGSSL